MRRTRTGKTLITVSLASVSLAGAVIFAASISRSGTAATTVAAASQSSVPLPSALRIATEFGVTPQSAAVAGLQQSELIAVLALCSALATPARECFEIDAMIESNQQLLAGLRKQVSATGLSVELQDAISETEAVLLRLEEDREREAQDVLVGLRSLLASQVGATNMQLLDNYNANAARHVPEAYKCLDLTEQQWADLGSAFDKLDNNAAAAVNEELYEYIPLTESENAVISLVENSPSVQTVSYRLANSHPVLSGIFDQQGE
ncbi:MAG: hypothetical protein RLN60_03415 [Phycisphaerales bacterium]